MAIRGVYGRLNKIGGNDNHVVTCTVLGERLVCYLITIDSDVRCGVGELIYSV